MEAVFVLIGIVFVFSGVLGVIMCAIAFSKIRDLKRDRVKVENELASRIFRLERSVEALSKVHRAQPSLTTPEQPKEKPATPAVDLEAIPKIARPLPTSEPSAPVPHSNIGLPKELGSEVQAAPPAENQPASHSEAPLVPKETPTIPSPSSPPELPQPQAAKIADGPKISAPPPFSPQSSTSHMPPTAPHEPTKLPRTPQRKPSKPAFDLEEWLGVRGAAVLGGIVLALAGIYLFKYSIEKKLLAPPLRVALGLVIGLVCVGGSSVLRKRRFALPADGLAGGGLVILYGSVWAAHGLYEMIHPLVAFLGMIAITMSCGIIALKHRSRFVAMLGLLGGFATPIMVSTGEARTLELFGYLLLLNVGVMALAKRMQQPALGIISVLVSGLYQLVFVARYLSDAGPQLMVGIATVFGLLYILSGLIMGNESRLWNQVRTWGFAICIGMSALLVMDDVAIGFGPLGMMLICLNAGACFIAYRLKDKSLVSVASMSTIGFLWLWFFSVDALETYAWLMMGVMVLLVAIYALGFHFASRSTSGTKTERGFHVAFLAIAIGLQCLLIVASLNLSPFWFWTWFLGWLAIGGLILWHAFSGRLTFENLWFGVSFATGFGLFFIEHIQAQNFPPKMLMVGLLLLFGAALQFIATRVPNESGRQWAYRGSALYAVILLGFLSQTLLGVDDALLAILLILGLTVLGALGSLRSRSGILYLALMLASVFMMVLHSYGYDSPSRAQTFLLGTLALSSLFLYFPYLTSGPFLNQKLVWVAAAMAPICLFRATWVLYEEQFGEAWVGLLPVFLGLLALGSLVVCAQKVRAGHQGAASGLAWLGAVTIGFFTMALPLQFEKSWLTVALALETLGLILLWVRLNHPGLKYAALLIFSVVFFRLVTNPYLFDYYPEAEGRIFTWLMYTYLVPVAAFLVAAFSLRKKEVSRLTDRELRLYPAKAAVVGNLMVFGVIVIFFVYLNLAVFQFFSGSGPLEFSLARQPARDLTLSFVWAGYGLFLMAFGIRTKNKAMRRISLGMVILTICKVFLYDLGELTDLYRAASLFGLAISLLVVSVVYQKFVAGSDRQDESTHELSSSDP